MATTIVTHEKLTGQRLRRKEDPRLITGTATYVDDLKMPGMHHACIVRSPHAAARIRSINTQPALDRPGVVAVFTGADVESVGPVPCGASLPGLRVPHHAILAKDRVYFVGHPVAVVVATDRYIAADAVDLRRSRLRAHPSRLRSRKGDCPRRPRPSIPSGPTTSPSTITRKAASRKKPSPKRNHHQAAHHQSAPHPTAMETRGVVADYRAAEKNLTLWSSTQIPHLLRTLVAQMLGVARTACASSRPK